MLQMRLITEAFRQIKEEDPQTALTLNALKRLVRTGEIPSVKSGRKTMVNYTLLINYLSSSHKDR